MPGAIEELTPPLQTRRYGRDVYQVRSEVVRKEVFYLTEIPNRENPFGQCTCKDWEIRIGSYLSRGDLPERYRCKHQRHVMALLDGWAQLLELQGIAAEPRDMIPWA